MSVIFNLAGTALIVWGYVRLYAAGGWPLVLTTIGLFVAGHLLVNAAKRLG